MVAQADVPVSLRRHLVAVGGFLKCIALRKVQMIVPVRVKGINDRLDLLGVRRSVDPEDLALVHNRVCKPREPVPLHADAWLQSDDRSCGALRHRAHASVPDKLNGLDAVADRQSSCQSGSVRALLCPLRGSGSDDTELLTKLSPRRLPGSRCARKVVAAFRIIGKSHALWTGSCQTQIGRSLLACQAGKDRHEPSLHATAVSDLAESPPWIKEFSGAHYK
mmetsp:Transcript_73097/g.156596  ORF Transcript_73097/g.156596 Transcript_73097/m.156596 type:complete len:221 (+) Transcript_73097:284-946(+)